MIYSGHSFFERAEVKDMMAYFKLAVNPSDDESFRRSVNKPARGIGDTSLQALDAAAKASGVPLLQAIRLEGLDAFGLKPAAVQRLRNFADMILKFNAMLPTTDAYAVATGLSDACGLYRSFKEDLSIESQSRAGNIEELVNSVKAFVEDRHNAMVEEMMADGGLSDSTGIAESDLPVVTLDEYLEDISLLSAVDVDDDQTNNKIALMTVHSAKGLEFPYVYVAGMEENLFPSGGMLASPADIEEERRLFYVALTRAQVSVDLSFAQTRMRNGKHDSNPPSRFIREIDPKYLANPLSRDDFGSRFNPGAQQRGGYSYGSSGKVSYAPKPVAPKPVQPKASMPRPSVPQADRSVPDKDFIPMSVLEMEAGMRIEHNRFGFGVIREITGDPQKRMATIVFDKYGEKKLLLQWAKMRKA